jgi:hypothetical protein
VYGWRADCRNPVGNEVRKGGPERQRRSREFGEEPILAMFRRLGVSLSMHWRGQARKRAKATLPDFHEEMGLENQRRAFALCNSKTSRALEA